jgi:hypothetical protein
VVSGESPQSAPEKKTGRELALGRNLCVLALSPIAGAPGAQRPLADVGFAVPVMRWPFRLAFIVIEHLAVFGDRPDTAVT